MPVNEAKLNAFVGKMVGDLGAAMSAALVLVGDRLGLYRHMADAGPLTSAELARRAGAAERYVREWLAAQAAAGYASTMRRAGAMRCRPNRRWSSLRRAARPSWPALSRSSPR